MEEEHRKGCLKIFFGYAAGVGKTYAMLQAAHAAAQRGVDVVAGYVEPHARPETAALLEGLEQLPDRVISHGGIRLREFDLDGAIARKPQLVLVDELAHTNGVGCRHRKRYQDIKELLYQGIDVYSTVNVQHLESLNDLVASITGITVRERIPDDVFDEADQVELVDIEPQELMERLSAGKIYGQQQAQRALGNFFSLQNLVALREIALRRCADRVNHRSAQENGRANRGLTEEHILVCLSSSPTNARIIRTASRMAGAFRGNFTALFVETPDFQNETKENKERLRSNIRLAEQLGARIETVFGEDIPFQIAEFARLSGVSKLVLGRSSTRRRGWFGEKAPLTEQMIQLAPHLDIYIIPDQSSLTYHQKQWLHRPSGVCWGDILRSLLILAGATVIGFGFCKVDFFEANIITVYIFAVLVIAIVTTGRIYSLVSSVISVLLFSFCFIEPCFTMNAYDGGYLITFLTMFLSAFLTSSITVRLKRQGRQSAENAYRTRLLFDTNRLLGNGRNPSEIAAITCKQLVKLLERDVIYYGVEKGELAAPVCYPVTRVMTEAGMQSGADALSGDRQNMIDYTSSNERAVAAWVYHNNKRAGATTNTLGDSRCLYLSVRVADDVYGVVGIAIGEEPLDAFENSMLLSILAECALALKNEAVIREREEAALLAKNEQLRANLLRSISHDLRTPLTSISGNAGILMSSGGSLEEEKRRQLYTAIYDDSMWLINLVENLLSVTRIEDGTMKLRLNEELLEDIVTEALQHVDRQRAEHVLEERHQEPLLLVKVDARLIMQVIINLVDNAIKYTPRGSHILVETKRIGSNAIVKVSDTGGGIPDEDKEHIFDMFYTVNKGSADSRRSLGLGLALCRSIVTEHGGRIMVMDRYPHGTVFTFTLPIEEVVLHE